MPDSESRHHIGSIFASLYRLDRFIGEGSFGRVFEAFDLAIERRVALKLIPLRSDVELIEQRFMREVQLAKQIEHGNVVHLYNFGRDQDTLFIAMEFVEGVELALLIAEHGALPVPRVIDIALQVLDGLAEAQRIGIVHRDLKPENILLTRKGVREDVVKLLDFGIATTVEHSNVSLTETGAVCGTPMYMAPEQFEREPVGAFTDIYALGLILIEMLSGQPAVEGETVYEIVAHHIKNGIVIPSEVASGPLAFVLARATHREPTRRFQSALEMFEAITAVSEQLRSDGSSLGFAATGAIDVPLELRASMGVDDFFDAHPKSATPSGVSTAQLEREDKEAGGEWWKDAVSAALVAPTQSSSLAPSELPSSIASPRRLASPSPSKTSKGKLKPEPTPVVAQVNTQVRGPRPLERRLWPFFVWGLVLVALGLAAWFAWPRLQQELQRWTAVPEEQSPPPRLAPSEKVPNERLLAAFTTSTTASFGRFAWYYQVKIKYTPSGSRLELDGLVVCPKSSCTIKYRIGSRGLLSIAKKGYRTRMIDLEGFKHPLAEAIEVKLVKE